MYDARDRYTSRLHRSVENEYPLLGLQRALLLLLSLLVTVHIPNIIFILSTFNNRIVISSIYLAQKTYYIKPDTY